MLCYARRSSYFTWGSEAPTQTQGTRMETLRTPTVGNHNGICVNNRKDMYATIKSEMYTPLKTPLWQRLSSTALLRRFRRGGRDPGVASPIGAPCTSSGRHNTVCAEEETLHGEDQDVQTCEEHVSEANTGSLLRPQTPVTESKL